MLIGLRHSFFTAPDGTQIAVHEVGAGRPLVLIHGYISDHDHNWVRYGQAEALATAGFRVVMPDLRAHGQSDKPHDAAAYPRDVLADDQFALIAHLGLTDYDLGGYSLGARIVARVIARGATPRRAIISGMGYEGLTNTGARASHFRHILDNVGNHPKGSAAWMAEAFLKTTGGDPLALIRILDTFIDTPEAALRQFNLPIAVICGEADQDNGSAQRLADVLPQGELMTVPGNHMSAVIKPELAEAMLGFLTA